MSVDKIPEPSDFTKTVHDGLWVIRRMVDELEISEEARQELKNEVDSLIFICPGGQLIFVNENG